MDEKGWMGAELIFDLDADHLEGAQNWTFDAMLAQIKKEMINLLDSFIYGDMGFSEDQVYITFSGGRGYHAHVKAPDVLSLGTHERREIVDYVTSRSLNMDWVFPLKNESNGYSGNSKYNNVRVSRMIPPADSGGWKLRMRNGLKDVVNDMCDLNSKELNALYPCTKGHKLVGMQENLRKSRDLIFVNNKMTTLNKRTQDMLIEILQKDKIKSLCGEVDEPVTADIKRLIRLPGSIHGKSGLKVVPLTRDELTDFDPMLMAVPDEYSDEPVKLTMRHPYTLHIKGETFKNLEGQVEVPEYAAVFLVGRKHADVGDGVIKDSFF